MAGRKDNNEEVRQQYVQRLINAYGYSLDQMWFNEQDGAQNPCNGVCDIVVWSSSKDKSKDAAPLICVQCKYDEVQVCIEDYKEGLNDAHVQRAKFFVAVNNKESRVYKVPAKEEGITHAVEIVEIPSAETAGDKRQIEKLLKQRRDFSREDFSQALTKCHSIIRDNDKLSPEAAFDEISKILFIKIRHEREKDERQVFSSELYKKKRADNSVGTEGNAYYQTLFEQTKTDHQTDGLFESRETLRIRENSFEQIVKELEPFNLSNTADDVKGIAYEQVLGRTFRGELGQFFTPRTIVDFIVKVLDPREGELICDPCCGSGGFLINAFEYVRKQIESDTRSKSNVSDPIKDRLHRLSHDYIFGTDANPRMARTAKMNMIMHGDGHGGIYHHDGLLDVGGVFDGRFNVILTNPPFGSHISNKQLVTEADVTTDEKEYAEYKKRFGEAYVASQEKLREHVKKPILELFDLGESVGLTEVIFIERCLNLLKPGGRLGIVLPEGVLNNPILQDVRAYIESKAKILLVVSIPQDVFMASGATVKSSLLFLKKFTEEEATQYEAIEAKAHEEAIKPYEKELSSIVVQLDEPGKNNLTKEESMRLKARLKEINNTIEAETKKRVKERFDYQIPIAAVQKAGISTTGAEIENELEYLEPEFTQYRKENNLW